MLSKMQSWMILKAEDPSRMPVLSLLLSSAQNSAEGSWVAPPICRALQHLRFAHSSWPRCMHCITSFVHPSLPTKATVQTQTGLGARHPL